MGSYIHKPTVVRAVKFDPKVCHPARFDGAVPIIEQDGILIRWVCDDVRTAEGSYRVRNPVTGELRDVRPGDYIVERPTGCIYPMSAEEFERNYSALPTPSPAEAAARVLPIVSDHDRGVCHGLKRPTAPSAEVGRLGDAPFAYGKG